MERGPDRSFPTPRESEGSFAGNLHAVDRVLTDHRQPLQAREVHAGVETLLGEPVRWWSVKDTLSGNVRGAAPRFVRVARGRYTSIPGDRPAEEGLPVERQPAG